MGGGGVRVTACRYARVKHMPVSCRSSRPLMPVLVSAMHAMQEADSRRQFGQHCTSPTPALPPAANARHASAYPWLRQARHTISPSGALHAAVL